MKKPFIDGITWPGHLGHFAAIFTFVAAIVATYAYFKAHYTKEVTESDKWRWLGRMAVYAETLGVLIVVVSLYVILYNHLYQYKFAYKHSSNDLPVKYLFSCFWEGQEGSFMLWIFWHCIISLFVMHSAKSWEAPVMGTIHFIQIFLSAFILGIYLIDDFHLGSSPFVLLRNSDLGIGPIFDDPDYLSRISDGRGLNITLQDPWMVIHPPTLFFGFASCTIPMAFAVAGLLKKDYSGWVKPALPWTILATCILGLGILMGAKWAYQSLSFGGYWAWDPVENASLVPWLIIVAGMHTMLIHKATGNALRASFVFIVLTFFFVIYSTCLTRTGILGDTSVHSFTGTGIVSQLWLFMAFTCLPPIVLLIKNYRKIPAVKKEEDISSREFWMFIGSLLFSFSAFFVIGVTSIPVINKLFGTKIATSDKNIQLYNNIHVPVVIIIATLIAITQYLKYKKTSTSYAIKKLIYPLLVSAALTALLLFTEGIQFEKEGPVFKVLIAVAVAASIFTVVANAFYWADIVRKKWINWGSSLTHIGFGMLLIGILISAANQKVLSKDQSGINVFSTNSKEDPRENLNLIKGVPTDMGDYTVTYKSDTADDINKERQYYTVNFRNKKTNKEFTLYPNAFLNVRNNDGKEGIQPNPDFKQYWNRDLFLYITSLTDPSKRNEPPSFESNTLKVGDSAIFRDGYMRFNSMKPIGNSKIDTSKFDLVADIDVVFADGNKFKLKPIYKVEGNTALSLIDSIPSKNFYVKINKFVSGDELEIAVKRNEKMTDYITVKVLQFPFINLMWVGLCVMSVGFMIAMWKRIKEQDKSNTLA